MNTLMILGGMIMVGGGIILKRGKTKIKDTVSFVEEAKKIYGDSFNYENVNYLNQLTKVTIICKEHGEFFIRPCDHIRHKTGCPLCTKKKWTDGFLEKARKVHGDKYEYNVETYKTYTKKMSIYCYIHGWFEQSPKAHVGNGSGCQKCSYETIRKKSVKSQEKFIEEAKIVHGNLFDYDKVQYINCKTKVLIKCPIHGYFEQTPQCHIAGRGCNKCSYFLKGFKKSGYYTTNLPSNLYVVVLSDKYIKVGVSKDMRRRFKLIERKGGLDVKKVKVFRGKAKELFALEQHIINDAGLTRVVTDEKFEGRSECFSPEDLNNILCEIDRWPIKFEEVFYDEGI